MSDVKRIPDGFHSITPHIIVKNSKEALDFYQKAFGAVIRDISSMPGSDKVMHAEMKIGDSIIMLNDEFPDWNCLSPESLGGTPTTLHLYVEDVDGAFKRAEEAGAKVMMPLMDMFWGDRYGKLKDPFGHEWSLAMHISNPTPEEMEAGAKEAMAQMA